MKKIFILIFAILFSLHSRSQNYTWMTGSSVSFQNGTYGTKGVASTTNSPGSRSYAITWTDANGNLWLFGGHGNDANGFAGHLNDLWKYNPATNEWTWMSGSNLGTQAGVYGTKGVPSPNNVPGARFGGYSWVSSAGELWMFGGVAVSTTSATNLFNDLWKYNIANNEWTWVSGSNLFDQFGVYGAITVSSSSNMPGSRLRGASFTDAAGNMWLFGGSGYDSGTNNFNMLNDLWKYDPTNNIWTWMKGSNLIFGPATYGTKGVASFANTPGSRTMMSGTTDAAGNFWMFGGNKYGLMNELWKYNVASNEWTWMRGSNTIDPNAIYGTLGILAANNEPGGRDGHTIKADKNGNLWLFGGSGLNDTATTGRRMNDLWRYSIAANQWAWMKGPQAQLDPGVYGTKGIATPANNPASRVEMSSWIDNSDRLWLFGGSGSNSFGPLNDLWGYSLCTPFTVTPASSQSLICSGESVTLTASGAVSHTWTNLTGTNPVVTPLTTTNYTVTGSNIEGCKITVVFTQSVSTCTGMDAENANVKIQMFPNPNKGQLTIKNNLNGGVNVFKLFNLVGQELMSEKITDDENSYHLSASPGIYLVSVYQNDRVVFTEKLVIE